jgi:hypothetical protein
LEATARVLAAALNGWPPNLIVSSYLSSATSFYMLASPAMKPAVLRYTLAGSAGPRVYVNTREAVRTEIAIVHDFAFSL